jgi:formylglycine-generating enzyme required for sulfatase activity
MNEPAAHRQHQRQRHQGASAHRVLLAIIVVIAIAGSLLIAGEPDQAAVTDTLKISIAGTTVTFEMVPVPAGRVTVDGKPVQVAPLYIGRTEVTWDMYDVYALGLDKGAAPAASGADAVARPSSPYGAPDYGWGHAGFPVISLTRAAAENFAKWLSSRTGRAFRLPTEPEWQHVAILAAGGAALSPADRDALAWHRGNADARTHPVAQKRADRLGLFDLFGNAGEWVTTGNDALVLRGGSFRDAPETIGPAARAVQDDTWNERDPQLPKSRWWLSDGPFAGLRLITGR